MRSPPTSVSTRFVNPFALPPRLDIREILPIGFIGVWDIGNIQTDFDFFRHTVPLSNQNHVRLKTPFLDPFASMIRLRALALGHY